MPSKKPVPLDELALYPKMTAWFQPTLLAKLLWRVIVSELFGQYADGRLMVAALDTVDENVLIARARQFMPGVGDPDVWTFAPDAEGAVWFDYVADLGDGFDSTYAIASLLAQERLEVDGLATRRGSLLVMGGDEVYPNAALEAYQTKLRDPYGWAFPDPDPASPKGPPVYALPGNHDWYDGLVQFMGLFARRERLHLGGWRAHQHRSYFALQLTEQWWVWGVDAQLSNVVDQSQKDYFSAIARAMPEGARIILCAPEPGWLYPAKQTAQAFAVADSVARIAIERCKGATIPLVIAGDSHHYSRYDGAGATQFVTSGGGGAFLHGTHHLPETVELRDRAGDAMWLDGAIERLALGRDAAAPEIEARYPTRADSLRMLWGVLLFTPLNPTFALMLGLFYWLAGLLTWALWPDALYLTPATFFVGFYIYTRRQEGGGVKILGVSAATGLIHATASIGLALLFGLANLHMLDMVAWPRVTFLLFALEMIVVGGALAAGLFGLYLYTSSRFLDMNHNDAFTSMRRNSHRNFLRIRIKGDSAQVLPIGLTDIPRRRDWRENARGAGQPAPAYIAVAPLAPHLIETPYVVGGDHASRI